MRVGDVYKINRMIKDGHDDTAIMARFKNDYPEDETKSFIKQCRDAVKPVKATKPKPKQDPLD